MSKKIFISYRRSDSADFTVALYNELCELFGRSLIFKDINNIPPGRQFSQVLEQALDESAVVLVIIGPGWIPDAGHRLFQDNDWVRQEIARALERNLRVVPVLINGAQLPARDELPEDLHPLLNRQLALIENTRFGTDVRQLANGIQDLIPLRPKKIYKHSPWDNLFKGVILLLMVISIGLIGFAWTYADGDFKEKVFMSLLGGSGMLGGYTAFTRQRWLELRSQQISD